ncbi:MAG: SpoIIE family protein phosphatase [Desulfobacterales bacterium]|nr:SpoIIE family protein phosphatase [Desulfobacterales bacterium]
MDLDRLIEEFTKLKSEKLALETQGKLLETFIRLVRSSSHESRIKATLKKTVDLTVELTGADDGSLFLLDNAGWVTDCILMRESSSAAERRHLIGKVLDKGLAGWVIKHRRAGLITDTTRDQRWYQMEDQPYEARSALAAPILKGRELFGVLSLVHARPGRFSEKTASLIQATVDHIAIVLENAQFYSRLENAYQSLAQAKEQIEAYSGALAAELNKGRRMQRNFLPRRIPRIDGWALDARFHPARQVSGDFYDMFSISGGRLGLVIADVCDKGVSAALFMGLIRSLIRIFMEDAQALPGTPAAEHAGCTDKDPMGAIAQINHYLETHHGREGIFATLFFGMLTPETGQLRYVNAGHESPLIISPEGAIRELKPTAPAVGMMLRARFETADLQIQPGDTLIAYTDGVTEAGTTPDSFFGATGVRKAIDRARDASNDYLATLEQAVFEHLDGADLSDDIAMIAVYRREA